MSKAEKETRRHHLREKAVEAMDEEAADELMESLPPFDWHDVVTKDDLVLVRADLAAMEERGEIRLAQLRDQLRAEHAELRDEVHTGLAGMKGIVDAGLVEMRGELNAGLAGMRGELNAGLAGMRGELNAGLAGMQGELNAGLAGMQGELNAGVANIRGDLHKEFNDFSVKLVFASTASMVGVGGLFLAAVKVAL